jgi:hypothetical protein
MAVRISLAAQNVDQWRDLAKRMRQAGTQGQGLRRQLRQRISEAGQPVVDDVKVAVLDLHVTSTGHGGGQAQRRKFKASRARTEKARDRALRKGGSLLQAMASATKLQITAKGIRIIVNSKQLPADQQSLPRHLDSAKGWRHPVFGNREVWVAQKGGPYFADTIKKKAPQFREAIVKAMDDIQQQLE